MSFQIFLFVSHFTNWTGHNLSTDNTLKKITQDVLARCSIIVSDHDAKLALKFDRTMFGDRLLFPGLGHDPPLPPLRSLYLG